MPFLTSFQRKFRQKTEASRFGGFRSMRVHRHPYVGIIQIRLSVEGHTFLSACITSSRLFNCLWTLYLYLPYFASSFLIERLSKRDFKQLSPKFVQLLPAKNKLSCMGLILMKLLSYLNKRLKVSAMYSCCTSTALKCSKRKFNSISIPIPNAPRIVPIPT